jgi:hypothetical protein
MTTPRTANLARTFDFTDFANGPLCLNCGEAADHGVVLGEEVSLRRRLPTDGVPRSADEHPSRQQIEEAMRYPSDWNKGRTSANPGFNDGFAAGWKACGAAQPAPGLDVGVLALSLRDHKHVGSDHGPGCAEDIADCYDAHVARLAAMAEQQ